MRIVLDAMGGDNAPAVEVEGAVQAVKEFANITVLLVGKQAEIEKRLLLHKMKDTERKRLEIINATESVSMSESPAEAFKKKTDSSIAVSARLLKENKADALVSAGNTGAVVVATLLGVGRIPGVSRPGILVPFPSKKGKTALIDAGGNVDCKPEHLVHFGIMGSLYAKHILKIENPLVGVLSVGEEDEKGNELSLATSELMKKTSLNFKGNVEGRDVVNGSVDVVACDGFVGNVILKLAEGIGGFVFSFIKEEIKKNPLAMIGALLMKPAFKNLKKQMTADEYGGAPLLGIKKPVIITHGSANAKAIKNSIKVAAQFVDEHINDEIEAAVKSAGRLE